MLSLSLSQITSIDVITLSTPSYISLATYRDAFIQSPCKECFTSRDVTQAFQELLKRPGAAAIVGSMGGNTISLAGGYLQPDGTFFIDELVVDPRYQGRGVGEATLRYLLKLPLAKKALRWEIRTSSENNAALALYRKLGFRPCGSLVVPTRTQNNYYVDRRIYLYKLNAFGHRSLPATGLRRVVIAAPSGNTTAIIFDPLQTGQPEIINNRIIRDWENKFPSRGAIEQCGVIAQPRCSQASARLDMLGGEFCGNASRVVAYLLSNGANNSGYMEVSGTEKLLRFDVTDSISTVEMPVDSRRDRLKQIPEGLLVHFDGITQLVASDRTNLRGQLESLLERNAYHLADQRCVGITAFDADSAQAQFCVWIKELGTMFDETACGSGSAAIGISQLLTRSRGFFSQLNRSTFTLRTDVIQPSGGVITVTADSRQSVTIGGAVKILYDGPFPFKPDCLLTRVSVSRHKQQNSSAPNTANTVLQSSAQEVVRGCYR